MTGSLFQELCPKSSVHFLIHINYFFDTPQRVHTEGSSCSGVESKQGCVYNFRPASCNWCKKSYRTLTKSSSLISAIYGSLNMRAFPWGLFSSIHATYLKKECVNRKQSLSWEWVHMHSRYIYSYFTATFRRVISRHCQYLDCTALNGKIIDEWWTGKNLEGSRRSLIDVFWHLPGRKPR
jgi:hypothetical protein